MKSPTAIGGLLAKKGSFHRFAAWLIRLPSATKMALIFSADWALLYGSALLAEQIGKVPSTLFTELAPTLTLGALLLAGAYRVITRFVTPSQFLPIAAGVVAGGISASVMLSMLGQAPEVVVLALFLSMGSLMLILLRAVAAQALRPDHRYQDSAARAVIYGAGSAGVQLAAALQASGRFRPIAFVDDDAQLQGRSLLGIPVVAPARLAGLCAGQRVNSILVAMPSVRGVRRRQLLERLSGLSARVMVMPSLESLASGKQRLDELHEVQIEDLLSRESIAPHRNLLERHLKGRVVMVTGAAGSIGSELCRQALACGARKLVMLDHSEYGLYSLDQELRSQARGCKLVLSLASITDEEHVRALMRREGVESVYHAAAYKHVPLVEENTLAAVTNNVFGTLTLVNAAIDCGVANFVLVSTDKAVRPSSVMGATKRVCELIVQALATRQVRTGMSIVRFGNVLASSGSVIPLFREQIRACGPVTVTHPGVTRYFMTIGEAAQLVIQAGAMGSSGEVFVLDMGEPIEILELAERMIRLSGLTVRSEAAPQGDIEIKITGLRPGEKLHEELLIEGKSAATDHPRIYKAEEQLPRWDELQVRLQQLRIAITNGDDVMATRLVHRFAAESSEIQRVPGVAAAAGFQAPPVVEAAVK